MSTKEVERFLTDLKADTAMQQELKSQAAGIESVITFAKGRGYEITSADVKAHLSELTGQALTDEQIDAMAGGAGGQGSAATVTTTSTAGTVFIGPSPMVYAPSQTLSAAAVVIT